MCIYVCVQCRATILEGKIYTAMLTQFHAELLTKCKVSVTSSSSELWSPGSTAAVRSRLLDAVVEVW